MTIQPINTPPLSQESTSQVPSADETSDTKNIDKKLGLLEESARQLAATHQETIIKKGKKGLAQRLPSLGKWLRAAHTQFATHNGSEPRLSYAGEWILDNFYVIERALRQVTEDLPNSYEAQLPKLQDKTATVGHIPTHNLPRVYVLAHAYLIHEKQHVELDRLQRFVDAYQAVTPLTMGEGWALPIMLRLALLESLALAAGQLVNLFEQPPSFAIPSHRASAIGLQSNDSLNLDELKVADENTLADEEVVAHAIPSLRALDSQNWLEFFENVSLVHRALCSGPAGLYAAMDFATRDQYRAVIEELSRSTGIDEIIVTQESVRLAFQAAHRNGISNGHVAPNTSELLPTLPRDCHVGYYLIDEGRSRLEEAISYRPKGVEKFRRWLLGNPTGLYLGGAVVLTLLLMAVAVWYGITAGAGILMLGLIILLTIMPTSTVALNFLNNVLTRLLKPRVLPKLDFSEGVPTSCRTIVVVPALISNSADIESLVQQLELHYLRSTDGILVNNNTREDEKVSDAAITKPEYSNITFALLTDFSDAPDETMSEDSELIEVATAAIDALNAKYAARPFYLFHRHRLWNESEKVWMGWERKRGKLSEFNRLLRGDKTTTYTTQVGDLKRLSSVRYVITLDADTVLPRGEAQRLIGTMAHPLNRAHFNSEGKVEAGYTILQPRTEIQATNRPKSLFARVFGGDTGFDLYTLAVSDIYQDLFGEGIFVGKGIYDVDAFERSLAGRIPENHILSHDLFEGIHGRAGLVTDVVLYEDYPPHYLVSVLRSHRWVRGDWQLLPWLFAKVPAEPPANRVESEEGHEYSIPNDLSLIDRWKIFDNLRRSLLSPLLLAFFVAGWTILPGSAWVWTILAVLAPSTGLITAIGNGLVRWTQGDDAQMIRLDIRNHAIRWLLFIAFLPYESLLLLDAIITTLVRLYIRRRRLLQWVTAARTVRLFGDEMSVATTFGKMLPSLFFVATLISLVLWINPIALVVAGPFFAVWLLAWWIAHTISRPEEIESKPLSTPQRQEMRVLARRTWLFYEHFVGPDDNWLPPDHFQEDPRGVVAHRTSPTNTGMYLLSALAAHDLGYIGPMNLAARLQSTFETFDRLDRYRGHFLNWIDTHTLEPLPPRYVSTVDSGNLAGALIALKEGCLELPHSPVLHWERWQGLLDLFPPLIDTATSVTGHADNQLANYLNEVEEQILAVRHEPSQWASLLQQLAQSMRPTINQHLMSTIEGKANASNGESVDAELLQSCRLFIERIHHHLDDMRRDVATLLPWLASLAHPPALFVDAKDQSDISELWEQLQQTLSARTPLGEIGTVSVSANESISSLHMALDALSANHENSAENHESVADATTEAQKWLLTLKEKLSESVASTHKLTERVEALANKADAFVTNMDFSFLYNKLRHVFHIGYNVDSGDLDGNFYDLVASEARIASLVAIAKRDVPQSHWLHLGRPLTQLSNGERVLLSWSGTMFEYLMPPLLLRGYRETLLDQSCRASVERQIEIGQQNQTPWGISESGFYTFDAAMNYQYRAFGAPGLGFKRGLEDDQVIAPYASLLAVSYRPQAVWQNLQKLKDLAMMGRYGLYEAIDFTQSRLSLGQEHAIVRSYMAHHQGMILLALLNYLQENRMVERFHADPRIQSVELLLQEGVPTHAPLQFPHTKEEPQMAVEAPQSPINPWTVPVDSPMPLVHYLSNGEYSTLITNAGGGYSRWNNVQLTRWRADTTLDDWGSWLYVQELDNHNRDVQMGEQDTGSNQSARVQALWSATRQPTGVKPSYEEVLFHPHMAEFRRRDREISIHTEIVIAPSENVEIRRIHITNDSDRPRRLRLTSYGEVVLGPDGADLRHQAFAKLFVESQYVEGINTLLFMRRPRAADEQPHFMAHSLVVSSDQEVTRAVESDRARFLGRGHTDRSPQALLNGSTDSDASDTPWLTGTTGATLDPVMALGQEIELAPHATTQIALLTIASDSRDEALLLAERYQNWSVLERAVQGARSMAQAEVRELELVESRLESVQKLLSLLLYPHAARRASEETLRSNRKGQSGLWAYGISGDFPILLLRIHDENEGELLQEILRAHHYWRRRGLQIDVVILNRQGTNYGQPVDSFIQRIISRMESNQWLNQRGGLFVLRADQLNEAERILLQTTARVVLDGADGDLSTQLAGILGQPTRLPVFEPTIEYAAVGASENLPEDLLMPVGRPTDLQFDNGFGGFSPDDEEYVIYVHPNKTTGTSVKTTEEPTATTNQNTPLPWINVIANADFGTLVSETGGGYTWAINSGENRLTSWRNDPISDQPAEVLYLRDEQTADVWTSTPQPAPADAPYLVRHGAGYSSFEHNSHGFRQTMRIFVAPDDPVKVIHLRLENATDEQRRLTATYYAEWVLGVDRSQSSPFVVSEYDESVHALLARNSYAADFSQRVAFVAGCYEPHGVTTDRTEFLGRLGDLSSPDALRRIGLSGRVHAGVDPCAAVQLHVNIEPHGVAEVYFLIGQGEDRADAIDLINRFQQEDAVEQTWHAARQNWDEILGTITVRTPDPAMNLLLNRWLLYQALACRLWGRSALYQSSGAYGFRDQLQDSMALIHAQPALVRNQILRAAQHQFEAGDVLHWWHPPAGQGVRTRITDDLLWLPYVTAHYVAATGDESVLQEEVPFLQGEPLAADEEERYAQYETTEQTATIYEHCLRAIKKGTTAGAHGIPLMGAGDWNDGMNRVGIEGRGESIWLGWFLHATLTQFSLLCQSQDDEAEAERLRRKAAEIVRAVEDNGWDGDWYRRAYYDDGTPLGSAQSRECRIDSIAQSWSVISGAADPDRAKRAMQSVLERLVRWDDRLILLFTPPFDKSNQDPGYIKGYLPGIRENGGQYTHAALWTIWAFAEMGDGDTAHRLFELINPILRADSAEKAKLYKVEPYVISADVYGVEPHVGRGGWTWYTGSSGWMYRAGVEAILGIQRVADGLRVEPRMPSEWSGFEAIYRYQGTPYHITVVRESQSNMDEESRDIHIRLDDVDVPGAIIPLRADGSEHHVYIQVRN